MSKRRKNELDDDDIQHIADGINDLIDDETLFESYDLDTLKKIIQKSTIDIKHYISLLELGRRSLNILDLFDVAKKTTIDQEFTADDIIDLIASIRRNLHFNILRVVIDHINNLEESIQFYEERKDKAKQRVLNFKQKVQSLKNEVQEKDNELLSLQKSAMSKPDNQNIVKELTNTAKKQQQEIDRLKYELTEILEKLEKQNKKSDDDDDSDSDDETIKKLLLVQVAQALKIEKLKRLAAGQSMVKFDAEDDCSYIIVKTPHAEGRVYKCHDCCGPNQYICEACRRDCHKEHNVSGPMQVDNVVCCCGAGKTQVKCKCMWKENVVERSVPFLSMALNDIKNGPSKSSSSSDDSD